MTEKEIRTVSNREFWLNILFGPSVVTKARTFLFSNELEPENQDLQSIENEYYNQNTTIHPLPFKRSSNIASKYPLTTTITKPINISLPNEVLTQIFSFMDSFTLSSCMNCSHSWNQLVSDNYLWLLLYLHLFRRVKEENNHFFMSCYKNFPMKQLQHMYQQREQVLVEIQTNARSYIRCNGNIYVNNASLLRNFVNGSIESIRSVHELEPLQSALFQHEICYFEALIHGGGSIGIISLPEDTNSNQLSEYGNGLQHHIGWSPISYGYHSDDGHFYWNTGSSVSGFITELPSTNQETVIMQMNNGFHIEYGPSWGNTTYLRTRKNRSVVVGCGYNKTTNGIFFTLEGQYLASPPVQLVSAQKYAAGIALHQLGDHAEINLGRSAFTFDIEQYCATKLVKI